MPTDTNDVEWLNSSKSYLDRTYPKKGGPKPVAEASREIMMASAVVARPVAFEAKPVAMSIASTTNARTAVIADIGRPQWSAVAALPYLVVDPAPVQNDPVRSGDFLLWPDPDDAAAADEDERASERFPEATKFDAVGMKEAVLFRPIIRRIPIQRCFFALAVPRLLSFSLTAQGTVQPDRSVKISGGTAILTVGVYSQDDVQGVEKHRQEWTSAIATSGLGSRIWKFQPQSLRNLRPALELPDGHASQPADISTDTNAGTATFVIQLSETGVIAWKNALEQRNGSAIAGICRVTVSYYGRLANRVDVKEQQLSVPLGALLAACGPDDVRTINPQQTVEAMLVVVGHDLVQNVSLNMRPNVGQAPAVQSFGREGGQVKVSIATQDVNSVEVNWDAQVTFRTSSWPVIPAAGKLSNATGWTDMLKPDSWIANYTIMAIVVDDAGNPVPINIAGIDYHAVGTLTFTAPYVPNTGVLVSSFDAGNQLPVSVALPRFPGQPFGDLLLNMFATRNGLASTQTRRLSATELGVVILIRPNAAIEIRTSADALPELSTESNMLGLLGSLI